MVRGNQIKKARAIHHGGKVRFVQWVRPTIGIGLALVAAWMFGCSSAPQTGQPEPTKKEIRSDADRFFEKVEKEERTRNSNASEKSSKDDY